MNHYIDFMSLDAKFDDLVKDLVAAEKSGEGRYAFFNDNGKLLLVVW